MPVSPHPPGFLRRLAAMVYDLLLLLAVWFIAISLATVATWLVTGSTDISRHNIAFLYMDLVTFLFFGWFWTHGGQTLGMRAWKLRIQQGDGKTITWRQVAIRFITALPAWIVLFIGITLTAGIPLHAYPWLEQLSRLPKGLILIVGIFWLVFDQWPDGWRDKISDTRIIKLNKRDV